MSRALTAMSLSNLAVSACQASSELFTFEAASVFQLLSGEPMLNDRP